MSDPKAPDSPAASAKTAPLPEDPIVAKAKQAMADLFASTITALGGDVKKLLALNAPKGPVGQVYGVFTNEMIDLLGAQVKSAFPAASQPPAAPSSPPSSSPPAPAPPPAPKPGS